MTTKTGKVKDIERAATYQQATKAWTLRYCLTGWKKRPDKLDWISGPEISGRKCAKCD